MATNLFTDEHTVPTLQQGICLFESRSYFPASFVCFSKTICISNFPLYVFPSNFYIGHHMHATECTTQLLLPIEYAGLLDNGLRQGGRQL